jgi:hypothetical protein
MNRYLESKIKAEKYWNGTIVDSIDIYNNPTYDYLDEDNHHHIYPKDYCKTCELINQLCNQYYCSNDENEKIEILRQLDNHVINGYKLLKFKEANGEAKPELEPIAHYIYGDLNDIDYKELMKDFDENLIENVSLNTSRWCRMCGSRKPDIIQE